jgi:hypothetical protein
MSKRGIPIKKADRMYTYVDYLNWPDDENHGDRDDEIINVVQPDMSVFCSEESLDDSGATAAPDIAVEILSVYSLGQEPEGGYGKPAVYGPGECFESEILEGFSP